MVTGVLFRVCDFVLYIRTGTEVDREVEITDVEGSTYTRGLVPS